MIHCNSLVVSVSATFRWHSRNKPRLVRWFGTRYQAWQLEFNLQPTYNVKGITAYFFLYLHANPVAYTYTTYHKQKKPCKKEKTNRKSQILVNPCQSFLEEFLLPDIDYNEKVVLSVYCYDYVHIWMQFSCKEVGCSLWIAFLITFSVAIAKEWALIYSFSLATISYHSNSWAQISGYG